MATALGTGDPGVVGSDLPDRPRTAGFLVKALDGAAEHTAGQRSRSRSRSGGRKVDEEQLKALWTALLQAPVTAQTHFFFAGGDSLTGALLVAQTNKRFRASVTLQELFDHATFDEFSRLVAESARAG